MPPSALPDRPIVVCTRGSALALAQSGQVVSDLRRLFPERVFEQRVIRTTGDQLQAAATEPGGVTLPRGLFTKELEVALLDGSADIAVHSLKDLPTELPAGLILAATPPRADPREVLLYRDAAHPDFAPGRRPPEDWQPGRRSPYFGAPMAGVEALPRGAAVGTSSPRRAAQLRAMRPDLEVVPLRGNLGTRLSKLREDPALDATLLAAAGMVRLHWDIGPRGMLRVDPRLPADIRSGVVAPAPGILALLLDPEEMLPAVGQGALGLETRADDPAIAPLVAALNHGNTFRCITAERAFLAAMGGGCQAPVAAHARVLGHQVELRAASYHDDPPRFAVARRPVREAVALGVDLARLLRGA